jgi:hypothetical protein
MLQVLIGGASYDERDDRPDKQDQALVYLSVVPVVETEPA